MRVRLSTCVVAIVIAFTLLAASAARAERGPFDEGTWNVSLTGSYVAPLRLSPDKLYNFNLAGGYYLINNTSANFELQGYYVDQDGYETAVMGGFALLLRTHLITFDRWGIFFDGGVGVLYADHPVPEFGTNFNFNPRVGLGALFELKDHTYLIGGARYFHVSNARIQGPDRNPSHDGIQYWAGMMWTW
jgi:hypothetical protein